MNTPEIIKKIQSSFKKITLDENHPDRIISSTTEWEELSSLSTKIDELHKMEKSPLVWINKRGSIFEKCFIVWW